MFVSKKYSAGADRNYAGVYRCDAVHYGKALEQAWQGHDGMQRPIMAGLTRVTLLFAVFPVSFKLVVGTPSISLGSFERFINQMTSYCAILIVKF